MRRSESLIIRRDNCSLFKENQMTSRFRLYAQYALQMAPSQERQTTRRKGWVICGMLAVTLFMLMMTPLMQAQLTTGSLSGTAADATGAVVPNAAVLLLN
jgi:hypothetical protein